MRLALRARHTPPPIFSHLHHLFTIWKFIINFSACPELHVTFDPQKVTCMPIVLSWVLKTKEMSKSEVAVCLLCLINYKGSVVHY